jgi:type II secretory ATPase GspE/PulE/Tfp pilus assembly ATPase PilB-like protein
MRCRHRRTAHRWSRGIEDADIEQLAEQTPIIRFVNLVLAQAIRDKASDIHFEPFEHDFKIRYRIDGALYEMAPPPKNLALPILSRLKVLANLNIAERRLPQDGRIKLTLGGRAVDLRVSTLPTQFGESVVLRVLDQIRRATRASASLACPPRSRPAWRRSFAGQTALCWLPGRLARERPPHFTAA